MASRYRLEDIVGRAESLNFVGPYDVCDLAEEITRLWGIEEKTMTLLAEKKAKHTQLLADEEMCVEQDWDEGHERLQHDIRVCLSEVRLLEKVLGWS